MIIQRTGGSREYTEKRGNNMYISPREFMKLAPVCCNDDMIHMENGDWICVWCSKLLSNLAGREQVLEQIIPPSSGTAAVRQRTFEAPPPPSIRLVKG